MISSIRQKYLKIHSRLSISNSGLKVFICCLICILWPSWENGRKIMKSFCLIMKNARTWNRMVIITTLMHHQTLTIVHLSILKNRLWRNNRSVHWNQICCLKTEYQLTVLNRTKKVKFHYHQIDQEKTVRNQTIQADQKLQIKKRRKKKVCIKSWRKNRLRCIFESYN